MRERDNRGRFAWLVHKGEPDPRLQRPLDYAVGESFEHDSDNEEDDPLPTSREIARNRLFAAAAFFAIALVLWWLL